MLQLHAVRPRAPLLGQLYQIPLVGRVHVLMKFLGQLWLLQEPTPGWKRLAMYVPISKVRAMHPAAGNLF